MPLRDNVNFSIYISVSNIQRKKTLIFSKAVLITMHIETEKFEKDFFLDSTAVVRQLLKASDIFVRPITLQVYQKENDETCS